jgi:hypothetical protein
MIVYNVLRRWFTMKEDAETYRKEQKLPVDATFKLEITGRDDLAALLNGLCEHEVAIGPRQEVYDRNQITNEPPDFIPKFLVEDWKRRNNGGY